MVLLLTCIDQGAIAGATRPNAIENQGSVAPIQLQHNDAQKQSDQGAGIGGGGVDNTTKSIPKIENQPSKRGMIRMKSRYLRTKTPFVLLLSLFP